MRTTLLSDAHVRSLDDPSQRDLARFLREWPTDEVVFVGDLVDVWWGWRRAVFVHALPLLAAMLELRERGVKMTWVSGNHDFKPGGAIAEELGVQVASRWTRSAGGLDVLAMHGDVPTSRRQAMLDRAVRGKLSRAAARLVGPDRTWSLIQRASDTSRQYHGGVNEALLQAQADWADARLAEGFDIVCVGHSHAPGIDQRAQGRLVNLGDWVGHRSFAVLDDVGLMLLRWSDGDVTELEGPPRSRLG